MLFNEIYFHIRIICTLVSCCNVIDKGRTTIDTEDYDTRMYLKLCFHKLQTFSHAQDNVVIFEKKKKEFCLSVCLPNFF